MDERVVLMSRFLFALNHSALSQRERLPPVDAMTRVQKRKKKREENGRRKPQDLKLLVKEVLDAPEIRCVSLSIGRLSVRFCVSFLQVYFPLLLLRVLLRPSLQPRVISQLTHHHH